MPARARQHTTPSALYIDIDRFKHVNDTFGHAAGDAVLRAVGARLSSAIRRADTVGRLGGDEFVVLLDSATLDVSPELVAERVLDVSPSRSISTARPAGLFSITRQRRRRRRAASNGRRPDPADADLALYQAKDKGKNRYAIFESAMQTVAEDHLMLEMGPPRRAPGEQLFLVYQPTFDLHERDRSRGRSASPLATPGRGVIEPEMFIPIAESTGPIMPIGRWVLHQACAQAAPWHRDGHRIGLSVNISARQLERNELLDDVRDALQASGLAPGSAHPRRSRRPPSCATPRTPAAASPSLKTLGIQIAIDDFGTGYSSLAYLRDFPIDALKIDRSFIAGIAATEESGALVHMLVQLGKTLGLQTLGEGIEEPAQLEHLQREHCDLGQGFLLARPLDADTIAPFLEASARRRHAPPSPPARTRQSSPRAEPDLSPRNVRSTPGLGRPARLYPRRPQPSPAATGHPTRGIVQV